MSLRELSGPLEGRNHMQSRQEGDDGIGIEPKESNRNLFSVGGEERQSLAVITSDVFEARKQVECPICLGIICKATVTKCGHLFSKECIEKSLRLGNHKCPSCRVHCPTRRSLKPDENMDKLISKMYPDNNEYEKEHDLKLNETEHIHNEQIKARISQTVKRQSRQNSRKQSTNVETPRVDETVIRRIPLANDNKGNDDTSNHHVQVRGHTSSQPCDSNKGKDKDSSTGDDHCVGVIPIKRTKNPIRRRKRARIVRLSPDLGNNVQANPLRTMKDIQICYSSEDEETYSSSGDEWCPLRRKNRAKRVSEGNDDTSNHHVQVIGHTSSQPCDSNKGKYKDSYAGDENCVGAIPLRRTKNPIRRRKRARIVRLSPDLRNNVQANPLRTMKDIQICDSSKDEDIYSSCDDEWCPLRRKERAKRVSEGNDDTSNHHVQVRGHNSSQPCDSNKGKDKDLSAGDDNFLENIPIKRTKNPIRRRKRARIVRLFDLPDLQNNVQANPLRTMKDIQICDSSEDEETYSSSGDEWCPLGRKKRAKRVSSSQPSENGTIIQDSPLQCRPNVPTSRFLSNDKGKAPYSTSGDSDEVDSKKNKEQFLETKETPLVFPESLNWGRSCLRSSNGKINVHRNRTRRLVAYLHNLRRTHEGMDIQVMLVSMEE